MHGGPHAPRRFSRSNLPNSHCAWSKLMNFMLSYHIIAYYICSKKTHGHRTRMLHRLVDIHSVKRAKWATDAGKIPTLHPVCWRLKFVYWLLSPFFSSPSIWIWQLFNVHVSFKKKNAQRQVATVSINLFVPASALLTSLLGCLCHDVGWLTVETLTSGEHGWTWEFDQLLPNLIAEQHQNLPVSNHGVWPGCLFPNQHLIRWVTDGFIFDRCVS